MPAAPVVPVRTVANPMPASSVIAPPNISNLRMFNSVLPGIGCHLPPLEGPVTVA
jgi:hypothetical protein